jgi:hypothetical protein
VGGCFSLKKNSILTEEKIQKIVKKLIEKPQNKGRVGVNPKIQEK